MMIVFGMKFVLCKMSGSVSMFVLSVVFVMSVMDVLSDLVWCCNLLLLCLMLFYS